MNARSCSVFEFLDAVKRSDELACEAEYIAMLTI